MPGGTPYLTAAMLLARPAGISWVSVPSLTASTPDQIAQLEQECWTATSAVDRYARQPLRACVNTETLTGPGQPRVSVDRCTGKATLITRRWPVTAVAAVQVSESRAFPQSWTLVPAGQARVRNPPVMSAGPAPASGPSGGNAVDVAPGHITWDLGRGGWDVMVSYLSAWPHAGLTQPATAGDDSLHVDDVTGWAGVTGFAYDGAGTEAVAVTSATASAPVALPGVGGNVQAGPGTLTLSGPLQYGHAAGTVVSALPADALRAAALQATVQALEGIDAIATQSLSGQMAGGTGYLAQEIELILDEYRRVI